MSTLTKRQRRLRRHRRVRAKIAGTAERPRVCVYRSNRGIIAQVIDDEKGYTLAHVNWFEPQLKGLEPMEPTVKAGELLAKRAKEKGVERAVFDRGGYPYHGHVKAFAEALRENGITI